MSGTPGTAVCVFFQSKDLYLCGQCPLHAKCQDKKAKLGPNASSSKSGLALGQGRGHIMETQHVTCTDCGARHMTGVCVNSKEDSSGGTLVGRKLRGADSWALAFASGKRVDQADPPGHFSQEVLDLL